MVDCGTNVGECSEGTQRCSDGIWGDCIGDIEPQTEVCDGLDNDCDGAVDEDVRTTYYRDSDSDGYGAPVVTTIACNTAPAGFVENNTDCDDSDGSVHPGASELCDGVDTDCSSGGGTRSVEDPDGDGHAPEDTTVCSGGSMANDDCDETNPDVHGGQDEYFLEGMCPSGTYWCANFVCCSSQEGCFDEPACRSWITPDFDYNCNGLHDPRPSNDFSCGGKATACDEEGPIYTGDPPECGEDVGWGRCAEVMGHCTPSAGPVFTAPMPCH